MRSRRRIRTILEPTSAMLKTWRALIDAAERQADHPFTPCGDLEKAAQAADRAVIPGPAVNDSPFVQLVRLGQRLPGLSLPERSEAAETLRSLALRCRIALDPPSREPRPPRADLEG
jgi:hypothetical protein